MSSTDAKKVIAEMTKAALGIATIYKTLREQGIESDAAVRLTIGMIRPQAEPTKDASLGSLAAAMFKQPT